MDVCVCMCVHVICVRDGECVGDLGYRVGRMDCGCGWVASEKRQWNFGSAAASAPATLPWIAH